MLMILYNHIVLLSSQAEVIVPGRNIILYCLIVVMVAMVVLCELALQQQSSSEVIKRLLWCLANHKMNCSASLLTAHVSNLFIIGAHVMSHDTG